MKNVSILGSTGSIGTQALNVIKQYPNKYNVVALSSHNNINLIKDQIKEFRPEVVHITDKEKAEELKNLCKKDNVKIITGKDELNEISTHKEVDIVLSAIVGFAGLLPTIEAIKSGKNIALANKETLVVAGDYVMALARKNEVNILPVDSEHSAIFQAMVGESYDTVHRLILTASGGPFKDTNIKKLHKVSLHDALKHPNWNMGRKITIDSATMMNKGLEVIEAYHLFKISPFKIDVVIHPQSIIHSMVEFKDRSIKAQIGLPDMRVPIQYALSYPHRLKNDLPGLNFVDYPNLTFEQPNNEKFPALNLAFEAIKRGGNTPCMINAANEIAVEAFLNNKIGFMDISKIVEQTMEKSTVCVNPDIKSLIETDKEARIIATELIEK